MAMPGRPTPDGRAIEGEYMANRAPDWLSQADRDLEQARDSQRAGRHEWACFASHQAAEKAVKALHLHVGQEAWGHVVTRLLGQLPSNVKVPDHLREKASYLDNMYVPSRYPNGHAEGAPFEHYTQLQSDQAVRYASEIVGFARSEMA